jgi:hypothetical protein
MEAGQALIEQMIGIEHFAMADEMDGGCAHKGPFR